MRFSVIVSCYNIEKYIVRCVDSILAQTYKDFEIILVDDGSNDRTPFILDSYLSKDSRIRVLHQENKGVTGARKAGAKLAEGDYIAVIDGDDWVVQDYLEVFSKIIDKYRVAIACCGYFEVTSSDKSKKCRMNTINGRYGYFKRREMEQYFFPKLFSFTPALWSKVFERELYIQFQMLVDDKICMGEDAVVSYPALLNAHGIFLIDDCLYYYNRENSNSLTSNTKNIILWKDVELRIKHFEKYVLKKKYDLYNQFSEYIAHEIFYAAKTQLANWKYSVAKKEISTFLQHKKYREYLIPEFKSRIKKNRIRAVLLYFRMILLLKIWVLLK